MQGKLLLVDDNEEFLDSTRDVMEHEGFHVVTATSGEEAVRIVASAQFDLVLMDIRMAGMNGVEALVEMKRNHPDLKVIMCTAYIVEDLIRKALEQGAFAVLNKPFEMGLLLNTMDSAMLGSHRGRVLVADRDRRLCSDLATALGSHGHQVTLTHDGEEAVKKASSAQFDILLLDVKLPIFGGLDVHRLVKKAQSGAYATIITGFSQEMDTATQQALKREQGLLSLIKPLDQAQLLELLDSICAAKGTRGH